MIIYADFFLFKFVIITLFIPDWYVISIISSTYNTGIFDGFKFCDSDILDIIYPLHALIA